MGDRDERGRLRLPKQEYIPFQRVLTRSNRSSCRATPNENRQNGDAMSRSHSYNGQEVNETFAKLSIRRRSDRSRSLGNGDKSGGNSSRNGGGGGGAPKIPFQRVLHRRRKNSLPPQDPVPQQRYRESRDRREGFSLFSTEYNAKYRSGQANKARRRPARIKNQSQLTPFLQDPSLQKRQDRSPNSHQSGGSSSSSSVKLPMIRDSPLTAPDHTQNSRDKDEEDKNHNHRKTTPNSSHKNHDEDRSNSRRSSPNTRDNQDDNDRNDSNQNHEPEILEIRPDTNQSGRRSDSRSHTDLRPVSRAESRPKEDYNSSRPNTKPDSESIHSRDNSPTRSAPGSPA